MKKIMFGDKKNKLRDSERKLIAELEKEKEKWIKSSKKKRDKVAEKNITEVVSMMTGIPVDKIAKKESKKLLGMSK